ncbi:kinase domain protein (macronuclear) [Tetrahymena thermophila SB210]|uniref:Kinase domain protein n=1 Tax=Tetrahymena thermophila (strain SB210) TaxID=312017 RepID=W7XCZ4_TETTS|nr:kinase domain protein [Tetrahymena thermophila SB210]EWS74468.1 kinase domain protein [Tetrahymena thermophila SB210]|eukprot:XP_012653045.1 kinase domain protein [Tetrahymena thermophila SB210]
MYWTMDFATAKKVEKTKKKESIFKLQKMLLISFKSLFGIIYILLLGLVSNAQDLRKVINQFNRDRISLKHPPFCIIRHSNQKKQWVDFYLSYDRENHIMYIQKNKEEPIIVTNFQVKENFVLCYESTLVQNQITLISLQKNYTLIGNVFQNPQGQIFKIPPQELPQAIITEYQFNITSMKMFNSGFPIRYSNNTNFTARYTTQIVIDQNNTAIDFTQFGLGPIPNYDIPFNIYIRPDGSIYVPDLFFFQYSYIFNKFYTQQWNIKPQQGGLVTLFPQLDDTYSTIQTSTFIITDDIFKIISTPSIVGLGYHSPIVKRDIGYLCVPDIGHEYQPLSEEYLILKHNSTYSIIKSKEFWNFHYITTHCKFGRNETNKDLYFYDLGEFKLSNKDWLGVIVLEIDSRIEYLLTQAVFSEDESELRDYRFYSIDLEKKTPPTLLTQEGDFQPIKGYYFYEGFTYYKGLPVKLKQEELNRYSMLYLVNGTEILKLQFNPRIMLNEKSLLSFTNLIIIGNTIFLALSLATFFTYLDNKKEARLVQEKKKKFSISLFKEMYQGDEKKFVNFYLPSIKIIFLISNKREQVFGFDILQGSSLCLPLGSSIHKMAHDNSMIYSILLLDSAQIDNAWKFVNSIKNREISSGIFNENHYIFSKIENLIEVKNLFNQKQISRIIFAVQENQYIESKMKFQYNKQENSLKITQITDNNDSSFKQKNQKPDEFKFTLYNEQLDLIPSYAIQVELILIRKFTIALKLLRSYNVMIPDDFLDVLKCDIFISDEKDININPLLVFYAFSKNSVKNQQLNYQNVNDSYLYASYKFIQYIKENINNEIPLIKFQTFDDCIRYYDFHISLRELQQRFKKIVDLGAGGFAQVYKVIDLKNNQDGKKSQELAIKAQNLPTKESVYAATKEFNITKRLSFHKTESIIKLKYGILINNISIQNYDGHQIEYNLSYFVMELGETNLQQELYIKKISFKPQELHDMMYSLCRGLYQLHIDAKIVHMDISLDNIIKTKDQKYKISDLGGGLVQRNQFSQIVSKHLQCKQQYLSPLIKNQLETQNLIEKNWNYQENIFEIKKDFTLLKQNDCYALGFIFYMVVTFNFKNLNNEYQSHDQLEQTRQEMISVLNKYKDSNNQQQEDVLQLYPDYLIEQIQRLLDYKDITEVFSVIEQIERIIQQENMIYSNQL